MHIKKTLLPHHARKSLPENPITLPFGRHFTDHMFAMEYRDDAGGWNSGEIKPHQPLQLDPAANILHYCQQVFEGQKAYRSPQGKILLFRPQEHARRFNQSLRRLCMPEVPEECYLKAQRELLEVEEQWVPQTHGAALYIRPTVIGTEGALGVRSSAAYLFYIILSPVGAYFANGLQPISLWVSDSYSRAAAGGTGEAKTGGNYAASMLGGKIAKEHGCDQVLWLDAGTHRYVEEGGSMNIFMVIDDKLVTPALSGTILPGITRKSVLELAADEFGIECQERQIAIDEVIEGIKNGRITEMFCTGTAAVIVPIGTLCYKGARYELPTAAIPDAPTIPTAPPTSTLTQKLYDYLTGLQYGSIVDNRGWVVPCAAL
jgi:branched-chain amino acid aminotransferase